MSNTLQVIKQQEVPFYGDTIIAVRMQDGSIYVPIRPICETLGLTFPSQRNRIRRNIVLNEELRIISILTTNAKGEQQHREMMCLPLDMLNGFLMGVSPERVKPEIRDNVIRYQRECHRVLTEAFWEGRLDPDNNFSELLKENTPAVQSYLTSQQILKLARAQVLLEAKVIDHHSRIGQLEALAGDTKQAISQPQASQISQAVKAIAYELGQRSGRNEYAGVYGELYRRFEVTSYKLLPKHKFSEAMQFLTSWYQQVTDKEEVPF